MSRVNPNVNYGLQVTMKFQHGFISYNKCKTLEGRLLVGEMVGEPELREQGVYGNSVFSTHFSWNLKLVKIY